MNSVNIFFLVILSTFHYVPFVVGSGGCHIEAIYSFGDSLADTGNLLIEGLSENFADIAKKPYGMTSFPTPTGRCSDGFLMIDYFAKGLNLPVLPPFLSKQSDKKHGINFAVAGATAMEKSFFADKGVMFPFTSSSLETQVGWFEEHVKSICPKIEECKEKFKKSLFFVGEIGGNDYNYALFSGKQADQLKDYVPLIINKITTAAQKVMDAGATNLVIPGNFPIGCFPSYLTLFYTTEPSAFDDNHCLKDLNSFATYHNIKLVQAISTLSKHNPHVTIMYADYYGAFLSLLTKPVFDRTALLKACCGGGEDYNFSISTLCGSPNSGVCKNPEKSISWDGLHLTQEAYKEIVGELMFGGHTYPHGDLWKHWACNKTQLVG